MLSLVVCTYNRSQLLKIAIQSLINQNAKQDSYEIIIIDNNSTDNTEKIVKEFLETPNIFFYKENKQGLSHARNAGWQKARYEYVAYIDDDAQAPENYIEKAIEIINTKNPDVLGGPIYPYYLHKKPEWFKDKYEVLITYDQTGWLPTNKSLCGSNMIFKKTLLSQYNGFDPNYGMKGNEMFYGEEAHLIARMHANAVRIYYDHNLIIKHIVAEHKTNLLYNFYRHFEQGKARGNIMSDNLDISDINIHNELSRITETLGFIFNNVKELNDQLKANQLTEPHENLIIEKILQPFFQVGVRYQIASNMVNKKQTLLQKIMKVNLERLVYKFKKP